MERLGEIFSKQKTVGSRFEILKNLNKRDMNQSCEDLGNSNQGNYTEKGITARAPSENETKQRSGFKKPRYKEGPLNEVQISLSRADLTEIICPLGKRGGEAATSVSIRDHTQKAQKDKVLQSIKNRMQPTTANMKVSTSGPTTRAINFLMKTNNLNKTMPIKTSLLKDMDLNLNDHFNPSGRSLI